MLGIPPDSGQRERKAKLFGFVPAIVTNNKDPDGWYRVKVRFPWQPNGGQSGGEESTWCRVATFAAGEDRGGYFLPEVDDEVLVGFENGDIRKPFVIGSLWNSDAKPTYDNKKGENNIRAFKSRSGHLMEFDDTKDKTKITFKSKAGSTIIIDDEAEKVEIHDGANENVFLLDMKNKKITVESKSADLTIKAKENLKFDCDILDIKIGDSHKMSVGGKYDVAASSNWSMKGGKGHLESASELTLKGSLVDINPPGGASGASGGGGSGASSQGGGGSDGGTAAGLGTNGTGTTQQSGAAAAGGGSGSDSQSESENPNSETEEEHQIEVQLVNALGEPQANVKYELTLPDGSKKTGTSGSDGWIRISGLTQTGDAQLVLPDIDEAEGEGEGGGS